MATKVGLDVEINLEGSNGQNPSKSLKDLKSELKELQGELSKTEQGTKEYTAVLQKMADVKDEVDDLNESVSALTGSGKFGAIANLGGSIASGFQAAQGAMALFGSESEEVEKALLKVQAVSAFADGLKGLEGIGDALNNAKQAAIGLWKTIIANPLLAITALVAGVSIAVLKFVSDAREASSAVGMLKAQTEALKNATSGLISQLDLQIKSLEGLKANEGEILRLQKEKLMLNALVLEQQAKVAKAEMDRTEQAIKNGKSIIEQGFELVSGANLEAAARKSLAEQKKAYDEANLKAEMAKADISAFNNAQLQKQIDNTEALKVKSQEALAKKKEEKDELKRLQQEANAELLQYNKEQAELLVKANNDKAIAEQKAIEDSINRSKLQAIEEKRLLDEKEAEAELRAQKEIERKRMVADAVKSIETSAFSIGASLVELSIKNNEKQKKAEKALAIAKLAIDTAKAISGAVAQAQSVPFPSNLAAIGVGIASVLANIAQAKRILDKVDGGGGSSVSLPQGSTSGGGQGQGNAILNNTPTNTTTQINDNGTVNKPPPIKTYVLQSDIENENNLINQIQKKATI